MIKRDAAMSEDRKHRYALWRGTKVQNERVVMFIGLNPSTADETLDDPTIRRCIGFAADWGFGQLCMANLFTVRTSSPDIMKLKTFPNDKNSNRWLLNCASRAEVIIAAWGNDGSHCERDKEVKAMIPHLYYLRLNKSGQPAHPLYLPRTLTPSPWVLE